MAPKYQVFISCKSSDYRLANPVYEILKKEKIEVFFSPITLEKRGISAFRPSIDKALDDVNILIVVGSSKKNLESRWVSYEWCSFQEDILNGLKPEGNIFVCIDGIKIIDLPRGLRSYEVFGLDSQEVERLRHFVLNLLSAWRQNEVPNGLLALNKVDKFIYSDKYLFILRMISEHRRYGIELELLQKGIDNTIHLTDLELIQAINLMKSQEYIRIEDNIVYIGNAGIDHLYK